MPYPEGPQPFELEKNAWYLDSENSLLCPECAAESNILDEVPHFRPTTAVFDVAKGECCDQCSEPNDYGMGEAE